MKSPILLIYRGSPYLRQLTDPFEFLSVKGIVIDLGNIYARKAPQRLKTSDNFVALTFRGNTYIRPLFEYQTYRPLSAINWRWRSATQT